MLLSGWFTCFWEAFDCMVSVLSILTLWEVFCSSWLVLFSLMGLLCRNRTMGFLRGCMLSTVLSQYQFNFVSNWDKDISKDMILSVNAVHDKFFWLVTNSFVRYNQYCLNKRFWFLRFRVHCMISACRWQFDTKLIAAWTKVLHYSERDW